MSNTRIAVIVTVVAALLAVVAVVVTVRILGDRLDSQPPANPGVVVYEDGSGHLPAGARNGVLGDLEGRAFCLAGEACND
jgi:hypothetical protein